MREYTRFQPDEFKERYLPAQVPVVFRGLGREWEVTKMANNGKQALADYLLTMATDDPTSVFEGPPEIKGRFTYNDDINGFNFNAYNLSPRQLIENLLDYSDQSNSSSLYAGSMRADKYFPGFQADTPFPLASNSIIPRLWLGNRARIAAHFDIPQNIACVVSGRRKFTLFPPDQIANLYIGPLDFTPAGQPLSLVDFHSPDFERFPGFKKALSHAKTVILEPGDGIFIPSLWWHHVESEGDFNLLVNYWWSEAHTESDIPLYTLVHGFLSLRGLPEYERRSWKPLFEHYLFGDKSPLAHVPESAQGVAAPLSKNSARKIRALLTKALTN